ncbi:MAG: hypothetical protein U5K72_02860 [Balneolaceae bacterium]|nr:hypothetical protein [Balneolaceae bacterium]
MFSIDEDEPEQDRGINLFTMIGASWEVGDFSYAGQGATEEERLDFNDSILRFRFESQGLDLSLGFGGSLTGMDNTSYVNVSGRLFNSFPLIRSESFMLLAPLQITSDLKQVQQNRSEAEFLQSSLSLGTGVSTFFSLGDRISFNIKATPNYGFSFSQGSLFGGNLFRFDGKGLLFIDDLFGSNALSFGYHFDYRTYRIEGNLNDYDYTSHSVTIGYAF